MEQPYTDILIRIRQGGRTVLAEAWLSDGSFYQGTTRLTAKLIDQLRQHELDPARYGELLFNALFNGPIGTAYDVATGLARRISDRRLRIRLLLDESLPDDLHAIKWERIPNTQAIPFAVDRDTAFSRYMALPDAEPSPLDQPVVRLLFVISAPNNLSSWNLAPINVEREVRRLVGALGDVFQSERCSAAILPGQTGLSPELRAKLTAAGCEICDGPATLDNIADRLRDRHVLHFLGHGQQSNEHGWLVLENEDGTLQREIDTDLAARLGNTAVCLVFLAACESAQPSRGRTEAPDAAQISFHGLAATLVRQGIPAVIGMQDQLNIDSAYKLAGEFYRRLFLEHGIVDRALNEARALLFHRKEMDWATPVLTMRLKTGQLAIANPVWTALQAIARDDDYTAFRPPRQYVPLPLQAMLVARGQAVSQYEAPEPQRIGTLDLIESALRHLSSKEFLAADPTSPGSLVLVLGGPSTGKSTQMKRLGWATVQAGLKAPGETFFLPLYLGLEDYRAGAPEMLEDEILSHLRPFLPDLAARSLGELAQEMPHVRLRILLNAGDTMPDEGRDLVRMAVTLARANPRHQYVLAAQPSALDWNDVSDIDSSHLCVLAIQSLTQRGIRHALEAQGEPGQRLMAALYDSSLFDLASTPFFFVKLLAWAQKGQIPASRAEVLGELVDEAIGQIPAGEGMRSNALRTLYEMALAMQRADRAVWSIGDAFRAMSAVRAERGYQIEELYAALVKQQLLLALGEEALRFAYSSLQAYCCAQAILALPDRDAILHDLVSSLGSPIMMQWWEETLVIASGLLALKRHPDDQRTLQRLLEPIIHGADLLQGTRVFLGARCLLECRSVLTTSADSKTRQELDKLVDHVVNALRWRSDSAVEPDLERRLQATQLLAQLAPPDVAMSLAQKAYCLVRKNVAGDWDYEFSSVRFAAAIALKRMAPDRAAQALADISPILVDLFPAWQRQDIETLIRFTAGADDLGIQGLAALALGDLHGPLSLTRPQDARCVLDCLKDMFTNAETRENVRWSVADALSLLDGALVAEAVVEPLLQERDPASGTTKIDKALAYLIGLLRLRDRKSHEFLVSDCLGIDDQGRAKDWRIWATTITALGRVGAEADARLLADIAAGRVAGRDLQALFPQEAQRTWLRREAIYALANQDNLELLSPEDGHRLAADPTLSRAYYQVIQEIYWRREATARISQGQRC